MRIYQHDDSGKAIGSMKLAPSILSAPVMTVEQRRASLLLSALSDVEKMGTPQKSRDVCDAQAEARGLRADIRHLRRILDVFACEMKKQMEPPILGESNESLRAKRSKHLCAADSALREYIAKHEQIEMPATQKISAPATAPSEISTDLRKRILAGGILALCLLSLFWTDYRDRKVIGLTELVALCGSWACAVWLWQPSYLDCCAVFLMRALKAARAALMFVCVWLMVMGVPILGAVISIKERDASPFLAIVAVIACCFAVAAMVRFFFRWLFPHAGEYRKAKPQRPTLPGAPPEFLDALEERKKKAGWK